MDAELIIGATVALFALLAGAAAIGAVLYASGRFEYLGGKKKADIAPIGKDALREKILALNAPDLPYQIQPDQHTDLVLEWKIADAQWYGIFSKERIEKVYRALILLDEPRHSVCYHEELGSVAWHAGTDELWNPSVRYQSQFFKGRVLFKKQWGVRYGIGEDHPLGKVYEYRFDVSTVRDPLRKVVEESGWEFVPVTRRDHAMREG